MAGMVDKEGYDNVFDSDFIKEDIKTNDELDLSILDDYMNIALLTIAPAPPLLPPQELFTL